MKSESFTTIILEAEQGHYLTQADDSLALRDRVVASRLALGRNDSAGNWREITQEEADEIKRNQEAEAEAEAQAAE